jgi:DHA1 family inner membrane transport protein
MNKFYAIHAGHHFDSYRSGPDAVHMSSTQSYLPTDQETAPQTPFGLGWALFALALGGLGIGIGEFTPMGLLPTIAQGVDVSIPRAGWLISAYALGVVVGAPLIAVFGGGIPRRRLLLGLMAVFTVGNLLSALAFGFPTLLAARFFAGLPHGAFFGVASLVAAELSPPDRRARAVARILLGLAIANVGGVPLATWLGQTLGWRSSFGLVAVVTGVTFTLIRLCVPQSAQPEPTTGARALRALLRPGVLLLLGAAAVGLGGMFAVYSYITPTLTHRAGLPSGAVPAVLAVWGLGMVVGNLAGGYLADRFPDSAPFVILTVFAAFLAVFAVVSTSPVGAVVGVFTIGTSFAIVPCLQSRLMDVAADAQTLAAAGNHAAGNLANALGAWLGGVAIDLGGGWASPAWVGVAMAAAGLLFLAAARTQWRDTA